MPSKQKKQLFKKKDGEMWGKVEEIVYLCTREKIPPEIRK
jgi:hypothetical protein